MSKRAMGLYATPLDWPALLALGPAALVAIDPYHLPLAPSAAVEFVWRPWVGRRLRDVTPDQWLRMVEREWAAKGRRAFRGLILLNEPNLGGESGYPEGSEEAAAAVNAWMAVAVPLVRARWPGVEVHTPPLSPKVDGYLDFWRWLAPTVALCDVLDVHHYLDDGTVYKRVHALYPDLPVVMSECGRPGGGTAAYGGELLAFWDRLPAYVRWAAPFQWQCVAPWLDWGLEGTAAAAVIASG